VQGGREGGEGGVTEVMNHNGCREVLNVGKVE
jgi:hypothetical protein